MSVSKRRCRNCKKYYPVEEGRLVNDGFYCTEHCVAQYAMKNISKGRKIIEKERKRLKREFYDGDIKTRREAAVRAFNAFIRLRDRGKHCVSCAEPWNPQFQAGHFITAGSCTALRFDERNCWGQCVRCNHYLSGHVAEYRKNLIDRIGQDQVDILEGPQPTIKITAEWYKSIEETYKGKCHEIESN